MRGEIIDEGCIHDKSKGPRPSHIDDFFSSNHPCNQCRSFPNTYSYSTRLVFKPHQQTRRAMGFRGRTG